MTIALPSRKLIVWSGNPRAWGGTGGGGGGGTPANGYVAEDNTTFYVAEDGTTYYVQES